MGYFTRVLTEAEEECIDTHVVHTEESMSYEVATKYQSLQQQKQYMISDERQVTQ